MTNRYPLPPLDDRAAEALLAGRVVPGWDDLSAAVGIVRNLAAGPAPAPRPELARVLEAGLSPVPAPTPHVRRVPWAARLAVGVAAFAGVALSAATANALPAQIQDAVADAVDAVTPFQLPRPDHAPPAGGATDDGPALAPSTVPSPPRVPRPDGVRPQPGPAETDTGDQRTGGNPGDQRTDPDTRDQRTDPADEPTADSTGDAETRTQGEPAPSAQRPPDPDAEVEPALPDGGGNDGPAAGRD